jgi:hypothetical protein
VQKLKGSHIVSNIFFIRGTISVQVNGDKPKLWVSPCTGFLTPDKERAIAFPVLSPKGETKGKKGNAKLIKSSKDKQFKFRAKAIRDHIPALLAIAAQQKPIELRFEESEPTELNIIGFIFPAPSDHAHGR